MATIVIRTHLSKSVALASALSTAGDLDVTPTADDLAALTPEQRALLADYSHLSDTPFNYRRLTVTVPGFAGVGPALDQVIAERAAETAQVAARNEQSVLAALAAPDADWLDRDGTVTGSPRGVYVYPDVQDDPRLVSRREGLAPFAAARKEELARAKAEREAAETRKAAQREERLAPFREACRAYVIARVPEFERAAKEGHDVSTKARAALKAEISRVLGKIGPVVEPTRDPKPRECPAAEAYRVLDAVRLLTPIDGAEGICRLGECEIVHADIGPREDVYRTLVRVPVLWGDGSETELFVLADEAGLPSEDEEDDI